MQGINEWYYIINEQKYGPESVEYLYELYKDRYIDNKTKVWKNGLTGWIDFDQINFVTVETVSAPQLGAYVNNTLMWILALMPIPSVVIFTTLNLIGKLPMESLLICSCIVNSAICVCDGLMLKKSGYKTKTLIIWGYLFIPVYIIKRVLLVKSKKAYAIVWFISYAAVIYTSILLTTAGNAFTRLSEATAIEVIQSGKLKAYPDRTIEDMVDQYVKNPDWNATVNADGEAYIVISGIISYQGKDVKLYLQYLLYDDGTFKFDKLFFNNEPQSLKVYSDLMDAMHNN